MKRHLIYHCCPIGNWRWNLEQLHQRWDILTGRKIIAVAQGEHLEDWYSIRSEFKDDAIVTPVTNDVDLRETASLSMLLDKLKYELFPGTKNDPHARQSNIDDICLYAHTKGVTRQGPEGHSQRPGMIEAVRLWTENCYHWTMDQVSACEHIFNTTKCPAVGVFKRYGRVGSFPKQSNWHFAGTFYWFKVQQVLSRDYEQQIAPQRYGAEAFPSMMWPDVLSCGCAFGDGIGDMYDLKYVKKILSIPDGSPPISTKSRYVKK